LSRAIEVVGREFVARANLLRRGVDARAAREDLAAQQAVYALEKTV
jgi:hypothetical protein